MSPNKIAFGSDKKCWWLCQYGHSYVRSINNERALQSCPICSGKTVLSGFNDIATTHPSVVSEWCYELNEYNPTQLSAGSHKKVWWRCSICGHKWQAVIYARTAGHGCPKCYKKKK